MNSGLDQTAYYNVLNSADLVYSSEQIQQSLDSLASKLNERFQDTCPVILCVMRGAVVFTGHLMTRLTFLSELDYVHATRYRNQTAGDQLEWFCYAKTELKGRKILVLDDILDEGITLDAIVKNCYARGAEEVASAVLLHKKHDRCMPGVKADYTALEVEDRYVFGFGMDYKGQFRHLHAIYAVNQ